MAGFFISLFGLGVFGAILIVLGLAALFSISASTLSLFTELFDELGKPLEMGTKNFYILIVVLAIVLIILSELGPVSRVIGKAFITFQFGLVILSFIVLFNKSSDSFIMPIYIVLTIIALVVGFRMTEDLFEFILEHPILSILSAIPASFFVFEYIWLTKEEFSKVNNMVILAKESLIITLIIFGIFTAIEILILIKDKL